MFFLFFLFPAHPPPLPLLARNSLLALYILPYIKGVRCYNCKSSISLIFCFKIHGKISFLRAVLSVSPSLFLRFSLWLHTVFASLWKGNFPCFTYFLIFHLNHPECMSRTPEEDRKDEKTLKKYIPVIQGEKDNIVGGETDPF